MVIAQKNLGLKKKWTEKRKQWKQLENDSKKISWCQLTEFLCLCLCVTKGTSQGWGQFPLSQSNQKKKKSTSAFSAGTKLWMGFLKQRQGNRPQLWISFYFPHKCLHYSSNDYLCFSRLSYFTSTHSLRTTLVWNCLSYHQSYWRKQEVVGWISGREGPNRKQTLKPARTIGTIIIMPQSVCSDRYHRHEARTGYFNTQN